MQQSQLKPEQGFNTLETALKKWDESEINNKDSSILLNIWKRIGFSGLAAAVGLAGIFLLVSNKKSKSTALARE